MPTGVLDPKTLAALKQQRPAFNPQNTTVDIDTFVSLYVSIPIDERTLGRRMTLANLLKQGAPQEAQAPPPPPPEQKPAAAPKKAAQSQPAKQQDSGQKRGAIGRIISDSDW
jgi:hypothetical protein